MSEEALRDLLFAAVSEGDWTQFRHLCARHEEAIREAFPRWSRIPETVRGDRVREQAYVDAVVHVARCFEHELGDGSLLASITRTPADNPTLLWPERLEALERLCAEGRHEDAESLAASLVEEAGALSGSAVESTLPRALGYLAKTRFALGRVDEALEPLERAVDMCEVAGDQGGVAAYADGLTESHRYLGDAVAAADWCERAAGALAAAGEDEAAGRARRRAARLRAGEPPLRAVLHTESGPVEIDEVDVVPDGRVQVVLERDRPPLDRCVALTREAKARGADGDLEDALDRFEAAAAIDPHDPDPSYQIAVTLCWLGRFDEAAAAYARTESLAPGWHHCRAEGWLAAAIASGRVAPEIFALLQRASDRSAPAAERESAVARALESHPDLAPLWLAYGDAIADLGHRDAAAGHYRRGLDHAEEPDVRTRLLVQLAHVLDPGAERTRAIREAIALDGNLFAATVARVMAKGSGAG